MFLRTGSFNLKTKQTKFERLRPPSPWTNDLADEGVAIFLVQCVGIVDLTEENHIDLSYKKKLLQFIYQCQIEHRLPQRLSEKCLHHLSITTAEIKISNNNQKLILSVPSHHVITCYYVDYQGDHIVAMKYVSEKENNISTLELIIFLLDDRDAADALCSSMDYCFRAIYIANERNSDISKKLSLLTISLPANQHLSNSLDSTASSTPSTVRSLSAVSSSSTTLIPTNASAEKSDSTSKPHAKQRRSRDHKSDISRSKSSKKSSENIIQNYLLNLELELKPEELTEFCKLLMDWQNSKLNVKAFVKQTAHLYGSARIDLLDDLSNFLPAEEHDWFLNFLTELKKMAQSTFDIDKILQDAHCSSVDQK